MRKIYSHFHNYIKSFTTNKLTIFICIMLFCAAFIFFVSPYKYIGNSDSGIKVEVSYTHDVGGMTLKTKILNYGDILRDDPYNQITYCFNGKNISMNQSKDNISVKPNEITDKSQFYGYVKNTSGNISKIYFKKQKDLKYLYKKIIWNKSPDN